MGERQMMGQANDEQLDISGKHKGKKHRKRGKKIHVSSRQLIKLETDETLNGEFTMAIY